MFSDAVECSRRMRATIGHGGAVILLLAAGLRPVSAQTTPPSGGAETTPAAPAVPAVDVPEGATVESLFADFLHYARLGRFTESDAYARALLAHPDLDPVDVMRAANRDKKSVDTLLIIIKNSSIGESAQRVLDLIHEGESAQRKDREQIRENVRKLAGNPQQELFAIQYLRESGEYAVPPLIQTLLDESQREIWPRVAKALARLEKGAVGPMVMALNTANNDVRLNLVYALGEIGYPQAVPYLARLIADEKVPEAVKSAAASAISRIAAVSGRAVAESPVEGFFRLGESYYNEDDAVRADPRLPEANEWYWDDANQVLKTVPVPVRIFGPVMAMRCAEEALRLQNDQADSIALWLAANIRREYRLGFNVERGDPEERGEVDPTRPEVFPRALYFSQAAGPRYLHLVLGRAVREADAAVALGAIEALRITAGESSLVGSEDYKQPLVQALRFPDLIVRLRAALALGAALPKSGFADAHLVVPLLAQAVTLSGSETMVVIDADAQNLNRVMDAVRGGGDRQVIGETSFYRAMERVRAEARSVTAFFLSTGLSEPEIASAYAQLRSEFLFARTPIVLMSRSAQALTADDIARRDRHVEIVNADADAAAIQDAAQRVRDRTGQAPLDAAAARSFALEAVGTLQRIALDGRTVFDISGAEPALVAALSSGDADLQVASAGVLALTRTSSAQEAIAALALDVSNAVPLRVAGFAALAESAKNNGNLLPDGALSELVRTARDEQDLVLRTAASQSLGALNLASNKASDIIRSYYAG